MNAIDTQREAEIRADERALVIDEIAGEYARRVCHPACTHPTCATYIYARHLALQHREGPPPMAPVIPHQGGDPT